MPLGARKRAEEAARAAASAATSKDVQSSGDPGSSCGAAITLDQGRANESTDDMMAQLHAELLALRKSSNAEIARLKEDVTRGQVEMASLRRNHQQNLKKVTQERDMFAAQLAKEQTRDEKGGASVARVKELEAQLRAARIHNGDLEDENRDLREENKQMLLRLQASKTLNAESGAYDKVIQDLVDVKLKLALMHEEREEYIRNSRGVTETNEVLTRANGELEKSRQEWVIKCARLEADNAKLRKEIETLNTKLESSTKEYNSPSRLSGELRRISLT